MLDLGSFAVESDTALISKLPPEEAAMYECLRLRSRDISAYVVDGEFSFAALEAAAAADPEVGCTCQLHFLARYASAQTQLICMPG